MDDVRRVASIETETIERGRSAALPESVSRYQFANDLGSARLELDGAGRLLTYEEYSPYGNSTFQAGDQAEVSLKRYRYMGRERDTENGFTYHGARYYAPWLGRWTACDPAGFADGPNLFAFVRGNPVSYTDRSGTQCDPTNSSCVDPTAPTPREEQLQQSLPESERYLPPDVKPPPPPDPNGAKPQTDQPAPPAQAPDAAYLARVQRYKAIFDQERKRGWFDRTFHKNTQEEREAHEWLSAQSCPECDPTAPPDVLRKQLASYRLGLGLIGANNAAMIYFASAPGAPGAGPIEEEPTTKAPPPSTETDVLKNPESMAALNAEKLGGQRVWIVGPDGASTTRAIRIRGNLVTYDTVAPAGQQRSRADMRVIANMFNNQGRLVTPGTPGKWWTGTHGGPEGEFGEQEPRFLKQEKQYGPHYGWTTRDARAPGANFFSDTDTPTVLSWCFSSAWCIRNGP
jgi:RHS repeat-associated protein